MKLCSRILDMTETEKQNKFDYGKMKMKILLWVDANGPVGEMESWKKSFPNIDFPDKVNSKIIDEALYEKNSGKHEYFDTNWEERTIAERIFYVVYKSRMSNMEIRYDVVVNDEVCVTQTIDDPEVIWYMWIDGCFSEEELSEEALRDFVGLMTDSHHDKGSFVDDSDINDIKVVNLEINTRIS